MTATDIAMASMLTEMGEAIRDVSMATADGKLDQQEADHCRKQLEDVAGAAIAVAEALQRRVRAPEPVAPWLRAAGQR